MNKKAFTLIELLVAVVVFLTAVTAFHYLLVSGATTVRSAQKLQQAVCTIRSKMETLRATPFPQLGAANGTSFAHGLGKVAVIAVTSDLTKIELQLTWDSDKSPLKLATLRSKY